MGAEELERGYSIQRHEPFSAQTQRRPSYFRDAGRFRASAVDLLRTIRRGHASENLRLVPEVDGFTDPEAVTVRGHGVECEVLPKKPAVEGLCHVGADMF